METYTKKMGGQSIDWNKFLNQETHTWNELQIAKTASGKWVTCACGSMCSVIPRLQSGEPQDSDLFQFGLEFNKDIRLMTLPEFYEEGKVLAKERLLKIELRSKDILKEMGYEC